MIKNITTIPQPAHYRSPSGPFYYARHNGTKVIEMDYKATGTIESASKLICADTAQEVTDEITRLNLTPLPSTKAQQATAIFKSLPQNIQTAFGPAFEAISALSSDTEKVKAIAAITVPSELENTKAQLLAIYMQ